MLLKLRVLRAVSILGTNLNRQLGDWLVIILYKQDSFLHQCRFYNDSKPNSLKNVSLEVPQMAFVMANALLYWKFSSF